MALWKEQPNTRKDGTDPQPVDVAARPEVPVALSDHTPPVEAPRPTKRQEGSESVIGADLSIEGSITGVGSVRLAGRFTGDVTVDGAVTIESGAKLAGSVRASTVAIAGELEGNVVKASRVDVHASGLIVGDLKADTLTLAAGSRVRGHIECGWAEASPSGVRAGAPAAARFTTAGSASNGAEHVGGT